MGNGANVITENHKLKQKVKKYKVELKRLKEMMMKSGNIVKKNELNKEDEKNDLSEVKEPKLTDNINSQAKKQKQEQKGSPNESTSEQKNSSVIKDETVSLNSKVEEDLILKDYSASESEDEDEVELKSMEKLNNIRRERHNHDIKKLQGMDDMLKSQCDDKIAMMDVLMKERKDKLAMQEHYEKKIAEIEAEKKKLEKDATESGNKSKDTTQKQIRDKRLKNLLDK